RAGLLREVAMTDDAVGAPTDDGTPPEPLEVGDQLGQFTLPDLDGTEVSFEDLRGRRMLLVNWSPYCGYCDKISTTLARLHDALANSNGDLTFVASGDVDDNRQLLERDGLAPRVLLRREGDDPFPGFGTPVAYLLDEEGRVAAPFAAGADLVPTLAREA